MLAVHADVVIENSRPGTLERWNLGYQRVNLHLHRYPVRNWR